MNPLSFPKDFLWGAATASYQIEGAAKEDGRGASIWDTFCAKPGAVWGGQSGAVSCDHYHRWESDLDLMKSLGVKAYRFSVAWPRVFPEGKGAINPKGLDFYSRLVDGLLARGIQPWLTLYHWDLPQALEDSGGWRMRSTPLHFGEYCAAVARRLGDRVENWMTLNEMPCIVDLGHRSGVHAPGCKEPEKVIRQVNHHTLLAHGLAVQAVRANAGRPVRVGLVHNPGLAEPFSEENADVEAARAFYSKINGWMLDPVFKGAYPEAQWKELGKDVPDVTDGDLKVINAPMDYLGLNLYCCWSGAVRAGKEPIGYERHFPRTGMDWPINPDCLYWACRFTRELYAPKEIYITENGCAFDDAINADGKVEDFARVEYLRSYLKGLSRAAAESPAIKGYFVWSFMDNFEWAYGYSKRFGIVYVNYETQQRIPKASFEWYRRLIAASAK
ncbi:MAG: GH1 family beta-glucosidase [Candidatus Sumerlaeota bacterium]|nr:GH1 family beta-glucosidase [Candidatus Sumerlaeota bacterium]